ncbi:MAG TPA: hypothetical protein VH988_17110 [Thermoanaerobaculia bacterium]|jgi:hypothetical protein|nr:hypothetical protein [Thermoanaerobaculia bacterium]
MMVILLLLLAGGAEICAAAAEDGRLAAAEIALTEGIEAFNHGRDEEAVVKLRESLARADRGVTRYWLGLALLRLGRVEEAVRELEASLAGPQAVPAELRPEVRAALAAARASGKIQPGEEAGFVPGFLPIDRRPAVDGALTLSAGYDSNPNLLSEELSLPPAPGKKPVSGKDSDAVAGLDLHGAWHAPALESGWNTQVSAAAYRSAHASMGFLDYGEASAAVHLAHGEDPLGTLSGPLGSARVPFGSSRVAVLLQAGGSYSTLDGKSFFQSLDAAGSLTVRPWRPEPAESVAPSVLTATRLTLHVQDRSFFHEHEQRSGGQVAGEIAEIVRLLRSGIEIRLAVLGGDRNAGVEFSERFLDTGIEILLPVSRQWSVRLSGGRRSDDFDDQRSNLFQPATGKPRQDETLHAAAVLTWEVSEHLRATARAGAARQQSNVAFGPSLADLADLGYRRATAALGLSWLF